MKTGIKGLLPFRAFPDTVRPATGVVGHVYKRIPAAEGKVAGHPRTSRHLGICHKALSCHEFRQLAFAKLVIFFLVVSSLDVAVYKLAKFV